MKDVTFAIAMKEFFGLKEGQTTSGFMLELKELTAEDRVYFTEHLKSVGYNVISLPR